MVLFIDVFNIMMTQFITNLYLFWPFLTCFINQLYIAV